ncbi:MAG: S1 RNA-binding domain-containing protein, partial [Sellimonas sp.]|nr:S1 RNA-binding domain-containing protein [Sellimonas sp.]
EDLESYLLKEITVRVIEADPEEHRLILSAREILKEEEARERAERISKIQVGSVMEGTVESIQSYGAFVRFDDGLSGLVHVSQICEKRIKTPADVLKTGDRVNVKVIGIKDGKLSLSIKALSEEKEEETEELHVELPKSEEIGTNLGDLFKNIKL